MHMHGCFARAPRVDVVKRVIVCAVWLAGIVQTGLYADFFYYYFKSWKRNERLKLPA